MPRDVSIALATECEVTSNVVAESTSGVLAHIPTLENYPLAEIYWQALASGENRRGARLAPQLSFQEWQVSQALNSKDSERYIRVSYRWVTRDLIDAKEAFTHITYASTKAAGVICKLQNAFKIPMISTKENDVCY